MSIHEDQLSGRDFARLTSFIYSEAGICLGTEKKTMLEGRLKRRLRELEIDSFKHYCEYLFGPAGLKEEKVRFIDVVTTNKTDFFREPKHFDYLTQRGLPDMAERAGGQPVVIWSAGCSSGEEPYTLAMVLSEYAEAHPGFRFRILATDISTVVLAKAQLGIYTTDTVEPVPPLMQRKYLMRSRERDADRVRIVAEAGGVPAAEFYGRRLRCGRKGGRSFLPQRDHLLRSTDAGEDSRETGELSEAGWVYVRGTFGDAARHESSTGSAGSGAVQEAPWPRLM
jgi:hypothetical protein